MSDPQLDRFLTAQPQQTTSDELDPVTGEPYVTGTTRMAIDLSQAVNLFDWGT